MEADRELGLYVHFPWCVSRCPYCDFNAHVAAAPPQEEYFAALRAELRMWRAQLGPRRLATVFIGGGTPSLAPPALIGGLLEQADASFGLEKDAEVTLEANPESLDAAKAAGYAASGVTRMSIGVQSFDEGMLTVLGRAHDGRAARAAIAAAQRSGVRLNVDLMYALPGQRPADAVADVEHAAGCGVDHLSCYHLMLEPGTPFGRQAPAGLPDDDAAADIEDAVQARLAELDYQRYEVSAYGKNGERCRHNVNYWEFGDYLGVGAGAHGKFTAADGAVWRSVNPSAPHRYLAQRRPPSPRRVPAADLAFEFMLNALRLTAGFSRSGFERRTGLALMAVAPQLAAACERGWLERAADHYRPTRRGLDLLQDLCALFLPSPSRRAVPLHPVA